MKVKLSLHRPSGAIDDLVVTADSTATAGAVADAIVRCDPQGDHADLAIGGGSLTLSLARAGSYVALDPLLGMGESGIRSGMIVTITPASQRYDVPGQAPAAAVVTVLSGPDAGARFEVSSGTTVIGRAHDCPIRLKDPMVSKYHARLMVTDTVELIDLNSANGILVAGSLTRRVVLGPDDVAHAAHQADGKHPTQVRPAQGLPDSTPIGPVRGDDETRGRNGDGDDQANGALQPNPPEVARATVAYYSPLRPRTKATTPGLLLAES